MVAFQGETSAEGFNALAHAAQAVAFAREWMFAVVFDQQLAAAFGDCDAKAAVAGARVADDVGDGFAESEREDGLFGGGEAGDVRRNGLAVQRYAGGGEGEAGVVDLGEQAA